MCARMPQVACYVHTKDCAWADAFRNVGCKYDTPHSTDVLAVHRDAHEAVDKFEGFVRAPHRVECAMRMRLYITRRENGWIGDGMPE